MTDALAAMNHRCSRYAWMGSRVGMMSSPIMSRPRIRATPLFVSARSALREESASLRSLPDYGCDSIRRPCGTSHRLALPPGVRGHDPRRTDGVVTRAKRHACVIFPVIEWFPSVDVPDRGRNGLPDLGREIMPSALAFAMKPLPQLQLPSCTSPSPRPAAHHHPVRACP